MLHCALWPIPNTVASSQTKRLCSLLKASGRIADRFHQYHKSKHLLWYSASESVSAVNMLRISLMISRYSSNILLGKICYLLTDGVDQRAHSQAAQHNKMQNERRIE